MGGGDGGRGGRDGIERETAWERTQQTGQRRDITVSSPHFGKHTAEVAREDATWPENVI